MKKRRAPFSSASRTAPTRSVQKRVRKNAGDRSAKSGIVNAAGGKGTIGGGGARLVLQVWESTDGLRRVLMEQGITRRNWRCIRLERAGVDVPWDPPAQVVKEPTSHCSVSHAHARMRMWLIFKR